MQVSAAISDLVPVASLYQRNRMCASFSSASRHSQRLSVVFDYIPMTCENL